MDTEFLKQKFDIRKWLLVVLLIALLSLVLVIWRAGFSLFFYVLLLVWGFIIFFLWMYKNAMFLHVCVAMVVILGITVAGALPVRFGTSPNNSARLVKCYSTLADTPASYGNWKVTIYSGPLQSSSPDYDPSKNTVRAFSLKGLKDKTEKNSFYVREELKDGGYITGYDTAMEVCDENNMTAFSYSLTNANPNSKAGANVVAQTHYFHGGQYIVHTGKYRVDVYVLDLNKKWHLIARETGITITE